MFALALVASSGALVTAPTAALAAAPAVVPAVDPAPTTTQPLVRADVLPAPQINGVVWRQVIAGNFVYAGGSFSNARPFGSAAGKNTVARNNLLAYNLTTGVLDTTFAPSVNGTIYDVTATPDGTKLIVVGSFTKVGTVTRNRVAVFDLTKSTRPLMSTATIPNANGQVKGVSATNTTVFLGGNFSTLNGAARSRVGAFTLATGAVTSLKLPVDNGSVSSVVVDPVDSTQIVIGGTFTTVGGLSHPGFGLYRADVTTNLGLPLSANESFRDAGANAGVYHLAADSTSIYGTGWNYRGGGGQGNNEGYFQASWSDGSLVNLNDCHGDAYDVAPVGDIVYLASHSHNCITSGSVPQTAPKLLYWHSSAWTKATTGLNTKDTYGYPDNPGTPRPSQLPWYPTWTTGTYTGQNQAVWAVTGNSKYVVYGGEFTKVDGVAQQGLARFAVRSIAPNKVGPQPPGRGTFTTRARSFTPGEVRVSWPALWDRDDLTLNYHLFRNGTDIYQTSQDATEWSGQGMTYTDTSPGSNPSYVVKAVDPDGNSVSTPAATATVATTNGLDPYAAQVLADGATKFWRLDDSGTTVSDLSGPDYVTAGAGVTPGTAGAMTNSTDKASTFSGTSTGVVVSNNRIMAPTTFTEEVWFNTKSTTGGTIASFGDGDGTGNSFHRDRQIYMNSAGAVVFATKKLWVPTQVTSPLTYNDGQWHQAVASFGSGGMTLYVDGVPVGTAPQTVAEDYAGYWRLGGDNSYLWNTTYFNGAIDDFSVYPTELTAAQVAGHWAASGRSPVDPGTPTAAFTPTVTDQQVAVDGSASTDSDGNVIDYSWNWGDGSSDDTGATPTTTHDYADAGTYTVTLTVTDNDSKTGVVSHSVKVGNLKPTAAFTSTVSNLHLGVNGSGSTDSDGTVADYSWEWGDGSSDDTGATPTTTHDYADPGTYTVTLTVTDNGSATGTTSQQFTLSSAPTTTVLAQDDFNRTSPAGGGWGSATQGGAWTMSAAKTQYTTAAPGVGKIQIPTSGRPLADLKTISKTDTDTTVEFSVDKLVATTYVGINGRQVGADSYNSRIKIAADGSVQLYLLQDGTAVGPALTVPGLVIAPNTHYKMRFQVKGTGTTTLSAKVWTGATEPAAWQLTATNTFAALQAPGYVGLYSYIPSGGPLNTSFYSYLVTDGN